MCCHPSLQPQSTSGIRTGQEKESHAGTYTCPALTCAASPGSSAQVLSTRMNPHTRHGWHTVPAWEKLGEH